MSLSADQLTKPLKVLRRIQETRDAVSLVLEIPEPLKSLFRYQAGQFVTFFLPLSEGIVHRSYSLSSAPLTDQEFKITVKKVPGGKGSTFLCDVVKEGDTLATTPPAGTFYKPKAEGTHCFLFAAGSGITPVFSIMKTVLTTSTLNRVTLVFCNRHQSDIIYQKEIEAWAKNHPTRLTVVHVLTKPDEGWTGHRGRIHRTLVTELLRKPESAPLVRDHYICGPLEFMNVVHSALLENGISKEAIHMESFGVTAPKSQQVKDSWTLIGPNPEQAGEGPEKIIALINGETIEVPAKPGQNILETLLAAGAQPPYSCMDGACMACLGKIQEGRVYQEDLGILMDENVKNCESLTCQAKPLSRIVKVSYDNL